VGKVEADFGRRRHRSSPNDGSLVNEFEGTDCASGDGKKFAAVRERRGETIMNHRLKLVLTLFGAKLLWAGLASAQQAPPPLSPDTAMIPGGELGPGMPGDRVELLGFEGLPGGKVVTDAPFSAIAVTQTTHTLADGNKITRTIQTNVYRDSQGRVRK
jgi:hypothetical protein